jgi:CRP/FNR family transcriptional regulator, anaerobic regulatory protein
MVSTDLARLAAFDAVTDEDIRSYALLAGPSRVVAKGEHLRHEGSPAPEIYRLVDGWLACSLGTPEGGRQITKIQLPGDFVGMPSLASSVAYESIEALSDAVVEIVPLATFAKIFHDHPRLSAFLFMWAQEERVHLMRQLTLMGRMSAPKRIAGFVLSLHRRVFLGRSETALVFEAPLTQQDIADATGMSVVHANRGLRELRQRGMVTWQQRTVTIHDLDALTAFADVPSDGKRSTAWLEPGDKRPGASTVR